MNEELNTQQNQEVQNFDYNELIDMVNNYMNEINKPNFDTELTDYIANLSSSEKPQEKEEIKQEIKQERKYAGIFNSVEDLEKSYKELQAEYTRVNQKYKNFEKYSSIVDLLEKDPQFQKEVAGIIYRRYYQSKPKSGEEYDFWEEEEITQNEEKRNFDFSQVVSYIEERVQELVNKKVQEFFGVVQALQNFAKKHNLDQDTLQEIINLAKNENISLDEALQRYNEKMNKIREKIIRELGATPAGRETPAFTSKTITATPKPEIDFSQGFEKLPREKQLELLTKYFPFTW